MAFIMQDSLGTGKGGGGGVTQTAPQKRRDQWRRRGCVMTTHDLYSVYIYIYIYMYAIPRGNIFLHLWVTS